MTKILPYLSRLSFVTPVLLSQTASVRALDTFLTFILTRSVIELISESHSSNSSSFSS